MSENHRLGADQGIELSDAHRPAFWVSLKTPRNCSLIHTPRLLTTSPLCLHCPSCETTLSHFAFTPFPPSGWTPHPCQPSSCTPLPLLPLLLYPPAAPPLVTSVPHVRPPPTLSPLPLRPPPTDLDEFLQLSLDSLQPSNVLPGDVGHLNNSLTQSTGVAHAQGSLEVILRVEIGGVRGGGGAQQNIVCIV